MAIGDDAAAAGMPLVPGTLPANQLDTEDNRTRDFIAEGPDRWKPGQIVPVTKGGTGASTAAAARTALGVPPETLTVTSNGVYDVGLVWDGANLQLFINGGFAGFVNMGSSGGPYLELAGGTVTGHIWVPNSVPAVSSYTNAFINGDGRLSRGASSARYKTDIDRDPELPDVFAVPAAAFTMNEDPDHAVRYGYIAEDLADNPATEPFVVYNDEGQPESFDMMSFLFAQVTHLHRRVTELEGGQ